MQEDDPLLDTLNGERGEEEQGKCVVECGCTQHRSPPCGSQESAGARFWVGSAILDYGRTSAQDGQA